MYVYYVVRDIDIVIRSMHNDCVMTQDYNDDDDDDDDSLWLQCKRIRRRVCLLQWYLKLT